MKSDALYELSSVFSFFLKENGIETIDLRYLAFFHKEYDRQNHLGKLLGFTRPDLLIKGNNDFEVSPWKNISVEEYNFCLSRLSKYLTIREKFCALLLLLDACHDNHTYKKKRLEFLCGIANKLSIDFNYVLNLKKLSILPKPEKGKNNVPGNILFFCDSEVNSCKPAAGADIIVASTPLIAYIYLQEEMLAFVKVFDTKSKLNGFSLEVNKIYPMGAGDVIYCNNRIISFNEIFRHYFNCSQFASLKISATEYTPEVHFDPRSNKLDIRGCSVPENGMEFYAKLNNWLDNYLITNPNHIVVNIRLDYFNTTSSKCILDFLFRLQSYKTEDVDLQINWFFQDGDEDLEEAGLNYSEIVKIPFALIPYTSKN